MILDLYILHRFKKLPTGQDLGDLFHHQKKFLLMAESTIGRDFSAILERAQLIQRLQTLESGNPKDILPPGMYETLEASDLDPVEEAKKRAIEEIKSIREKMS